MQKDSAPIKCIQQLTAVQVDAPHEANVDAQPAMAARALQAHEGPHGQRAGRAARRGDDEGGPPRLPLRAVRADLILRLGHQDLEALLELLLRCHGLGLVLALGLWVGWDRKKTLLLGRVRVRSLER